MFPVLIRETPEPGYPSSLLFGPNRLQIPAKQACRIHYGTVCNGRGNVVAKVLSECPGVMLSLPNLQVILQCKIDLDVDCALHYIQERAGGWPVSYL